MSLDEERPAPRRLGKKGTLQSLTAAEYAARRGVSLFVRSSLSNYEPSPPCPEQAESAADGPSRTTPRETQEPKRTGKRGTWRVLSADQYSEETGRSLIARPSGTPDEQRNKSRQKPAHDADKGSPPSDT
jgi:hypothetical protein